MLRAQPPVEMQGAFIFFLSLPTVVRRSGGAVFRDDRLPPIVGCSLLLHDPRWPNYDLEILSIFRRYCVSFFHMNLDDY